MSLIATHCIHNVSVDDACVLCDSPPWDERPRVTAPVGPTIGDTIDRLTGIVLRLSPEDRARVIDLAERLAKKT